MTPLGVILKHFRLNTTTTVSSRKLLQRLPELFRGVVLSRGDSVYTRVVFRMMHEALKLDNTCALRKNILISSSVLILHRSYEKSRFDNRQRGRHAHKDGDPGLHPRGTPLEHVRGRPGARRVLLRDSDAGGADAPRSMGGKHVRPLGESQ